MVLSGCFDGGALAVVEPLQVYRPAEAPDLALLLLLAPLLVLVNGVKVGEVRPFDHARRLLDPGDVAHVVLAVQPRVVLLLLLAPVRHFRGCFSSSTHPSKESS
ncbi:unnamed protein product, partial [Musa banksii]